MPPSREQRVEQKRFYFDVGSNTRGVYLRISEVSPLLSEAESDERKNEKKDEMSTNHFLLCVLLNCFKPAQSDAVVTFTCVLL